jgi:hypothetical protein
MMMMMMMIICDVCAAELPCESGRNDPPYHQHHPAFKSEELEVYVSREVESQREKSKGGLAS